MQDYSQLNKRRKFILGVIETLGQANSGIILDKISQDFDKVSKITVIRDLNYLLREGFLKRTGGGRSVFYKSLSSPLIRQFDVERYFEIEADKRKIKKERLSFLKSIDFESLFDRKELANIKIWTKGYQKHLTSYTAEQINKELERVTIEFSWKSSQIEGNTYTLLDTERLIKEHEETKGKKHDEAVMILNHKTALEYAWNNRDYFKTVSLKKLEEIHSLISKDLPISKGLRNRPVGIIGTNYKPYDNVFQVKEAVEGLCKLINNISEPFVAAMFAVAGFSYIQPFEDGNKRTSRLIGNAILMANNYCPLSYRSIDEVEYKKAIVLFYEQHSLFLFKILFVEQYEFAIKNYFL